MAIILVPNVTLIPQDKKNACWYMCGRMMHKWSVDSKKNKITDITTIKTPDNLPELYANDNGWSIKTCKVIAPRPGALEIHEISVPRQGGTEQVFNHNPWH